MLFATFSVDYPILRETLAHAPAVTVTWEQSDLTGDGDHRMLVWVAPDEDAVDDTDDAFEAFDAGLETDPTVGAPLRVVDFDDRRLYHLPLTRDGRRASVYPLVIDDGSVLQDVTATHEGWFFRAAFPDDAALERFHEFFVERDLEIEIRQLYDAGECSGAAAGGTQYGLTERQRDVLVAAVDTGYLDIPRSASLAELAEGFDISSNAASERFRRGVRTLIENTVYPDEETASESP